MLPLTSSLLAVFLTTRPVFISSLQSFTDNSPPSILSGSLAPSAIGPDPSAAPHFLPCDTFSRLPPLKVHFEISKTFNSDADEGKWGCHWRSNSQPAISIKHYQRCLVASQNMRTTSPPLLFYSVSLSSQCSSLSAPSRPINPISFSPCLPPMSPPTLSASPHLSPLCSSWINVVVWVISVYINVTFSFALNSILCFCLCHLLTTTLPWCPWCLSYISPK